MLDRTEKGSESEDMNGQNQSGLSSEESQMNEQNKKTCADCGTTKTPLWRGGPAGPKSLCNACGIRSRKKRRAFLGLNKGITEDNRKNKKSSSNGGGSSSSTKVRARLKQKLLDLGRDVLTQRSTVEKQRKKLGEEEQAAVLLMALSYGSVYA